jgi:hypothetical protein
VTLTLTDTVKEYFFPASALKGCATPWYASATGCIRSSSERFPSFAASVVTSALGSTVDEKYNQSAGREFSSAVCSKLPLFNETADAGTPAKTVMRTMTNFVNKALLIECSFVATALNVPDRQGKSTNVGIAFRAEGWGMRYLPATGGES